VKTPTYRDSDGNRVDLAVLCAREPQWAANRILELTRQMDAILKLLEENGCDCPCDHHPDERGDDCEQCLACLIEMAVKQ
jgi:hypothetical protein